ncbi:glycerate kinase [Muriicola sp. Z0-33]|uniref:glycerate kinase n=1 Tax=Muriicola sp. Z0-33 TaxID=2816957 RepID=UPI002237AB42|nr:glycerate kinase [Muriicola sp. Z0-33]MCW5517291.1 glycerate kinase [Muriicola sp. Z0-33]
MNILLIPDKFKGSLTAEEVIDATTQGIREVLPGTSVYSVIASDGGDGFLDSVSRYVDVDEVRVATFDPLEREIIATYLYNKETSQAYIELAKASGMVLLAPDERNPLMCSTYGTGILIKHVLLRGAKDIYIGLGGSATNDAGIGIAKALGFEFFDITGNELAPIGQSLSLIDRIQPPEISNMLKDVQIYAVNDVNNPLYGTNGAAHIYAEQKGATTSDIELLDHGLEHLHKIVKHQFKVSHADLPGAGAAGGTAYGLKTFAGANFISGIDFIMELAGVESLLSTESIDCIITGEGRIDDQTLQGKLINGVLNLGKNHNIPVIAICGALATNMGELQEQGLAAVIEVRDTDQTLEYNMANAYNLVKKAIANYFKLQ